MELLSPFMQQALAQAARAVGLTEPNPRIGCVIVSPDGALVLGEGHTQAVGQAHAEVMALRAGKPNLVRTWLKIGRASGRERGSESV
jgi:pyrimidine deaminase RibD-like protein